MHAILYLGHYITLAYIYTIVFSFLHFPRHVMRMHVRVTQTCLAHLKHHDNVHVANLISPFFG